MANTRELAPVVASIALAAKVGTGFCETRLDADLG